MCVPGVCVSSTRIVNKSLETACFVHHSLASLGGFHDAMRIPRSCAGPLLHTLRCDVRTTRKSKGDGNVPTKGYAYPSPVCATTQGTIPKNQIRKTASSIQLTPSAFLASLASLASLSLLGWAKSLESALHHRIRERRGCAGADGFSRGPGETTPHLTPIEAESREIFLNIIMCSSSERTRSYGRWRSLRTGTEGGFLLREMMWWRMSTGHRIRNG